MSKEDKLEVLESISKMQGIEAIWFWGIGDIVRLQLSHTRIEFIEFDSLIDRVEEYFSEELIRTSSQISDLKSLPYVSIYTGSLENPVMKSYVLLSDVINLLNLRRKELAGYKKSIPELKKIY